MSVISPCPNCGHLCKDGFCSCGVGAIGEGWYLRLLESKNLIPAAGPWTNDVAAAPRDGTEILAELRASQFRKILIWRTSLLGTQSWWDGAKRYIDSDLLRWAPLNPEDAIAVAEL